MDSNDAVDELLNQILTDCYSEDEQIWALHQAIVDNLDLPMDGFIIGEPVTVLEIDYDGNMRRGLIARCCCEDSSEYTITASDVIFASRGAAINYMAAYRRWLGINPFPHQSQAPGRRKRQHKVAADDLDLSRPVELVALSVKERTARCQLQKGERTITLRAGDAWKVVPGEIITVNPRKFWHYGNHPYLSGDICSTRIDAADLGLVPLKLKKWSDWDPMDNYLGEENEPVTDWYKQIIDRGMRSDYEMEQVIPGEDPDDLDEDPIIRSNDLMDAGDFAEADKILNDLCQVDLRCLDAHAHLGNREFDRRPKQAIRHFEVGLQIGELSFPPEYDGVLLWGHINNRPFLRCLHGYGLCSWRLGKLEEASQTFERLLQLNPPDNQGVRFLIEDIKIGKSWEDQYG